MTPLPRLTTVGNALVARSADGLRPVRLKGLNRSGLQHKPTLELAGLNAPRTELGAWRRQWGATVIRLPMAVDYYMEKDGYQAAIDEVVAAAAEEDLYLILELHGTSALLNEPLPTAGADRAWAELARRYGAMPHVVFDLWNEPHDVSWEDWRKAAIGLIETIRYAGAAESLVLVAGLEWAYDLSPLLLLKNQFPNLGPLAYATHPYPWKGDPPHGPAQWEQKFGRVARDLPVLITEFGCDASGERPYGFADKADTDGWIRSLLDYADARGMSALAWSAGDRPQLTLGRGGGRVSLPKAPPDLAAPEDPFGARVRAWMLDDAA